MWSSACWTTRAPAPHRFRASGRYGSATRACSAAATRSRSQPALTEVPDVELKWWTQRIAAGLSLDCAKTVKQGKAMKCDVSDAGDPVAGIDVEATFGSHHVVDTSNAKGKVKLKVPDGAKPGKEKASTDAFPDWTDASAGFKVKKG